MKKLFIITSIIFLATGSSAFAEKKTNSKTSQKSSVQTKSNKKKTVGELLASIQSSDRGGQSKLEKSTTLIPDTVLSFNNQNQTKVNLEDVKPPRSSELYMREGGDKAKYEKLLDQQIKELYKLTQQYKSSPNRGELWLRLAELYVEKAGLVDVRKQDEYDIKLREFQTGQSKVKPKLDTSDARDYNKKAIQLYEWFVKDYPNDDKISQAYFFLGFNYFETGEVEKGAKFYQLLTKNFPKSQFVSEAKFALGEYYFENDQWANAYQEYAYVIKDKKHRLHTMSLYKGAWCLYRLNKYKEALAYLEYIIKGARSESSNQKGKKQINYSKLEGEALRDVVLFYAAFRDAEDAKSYFSNLTKGESSGYLEKLAYLYSDKGAKDQARNIFKILISENPTHAKSFEYQYQIVQNLFYAKNSPKFKEEMYYWIKSFSEESDWYKANINNKDAIENSEKLRETTLRNYVLQQHQTAQNSRAEFSRNSALEGYQLYINEFPKSPNLGDMRFYYGELLYDMNKFDEAGLQYKWVVENALQSKFYNKAAANLILSVERSVPSDKELQKRIGDSTDPVELDPKVVRFIDAANWYIKQFPQSEKIPEIKFRVGRLYYQSNHFDDAEKYFKEIVQKHSSSKYAEYSANLLLDIFNLKKDYIGLEKAGKELLSVPSIASSKAGTEIKEVLEKASFKKGQDLEVQKKYAESAQVYEKFAIDNPKSELVSNAIFNAAVNYERAGLTGLAVKNYTLILNSNDPKATSFKPKIKRILAKQFQDSGQYGESAKIYKELAQDSGEVSLKASFLFNAAIMLKAIGKNNEAISTFDEFSKVNKKNRDNLDVTFIVGNILYKSNQNTAAMYKFKEYAENYSPLNEKMVEASFKVYEYYGEKYPGGKLQQEWRDKTVNLQRRLSPQKKGPGASWVAKIKMKEAIATLTELKNVKIPNSPQKQKEAVDKKISLMTKLNAELVEVIKYDTPDEIIQSLTAIGEANHHMSDAIIKSPLPSGLTSEEAIQYRQGLEKIANPFSNKATESYKLAVDRAWELSVYDKNYQKAYDYMNTQDSQLYYKGDEKIIEFYQPDWMVK